MKLYKVVLFHDSYKFTEDIGIYDNMKKMLRISVIL